jgi:hypothetical protein
MEGVPLGKTILVFLLILNTPFPNSILFGCGIIPNTGEGLIGASVLGGIVWDIVVEEKRRKNNKVQLLDIVIVEIDFGVKIGIKKLRIWKYKLRNVIYYLRVNLISVPPSVLRI